jgi:leucyl aminopeptidase
MGNDIKLMEKLKSAGDYTFERIWELPLWDEFDKMTEAYTGDILNVGPPRQAGTIMGAAFLKKFIGKYSWAHLDIAGTAIMPKDSDYISKNASGVGVRLLTRFLIGESG